MADREKVIYSIERCICHVPDACRDCGYDNHEYNECVEKLLRDALELLKEQVEVVHCKDCKHSIDYSALYGVRPYMCEKHDEFRDANWFCADGERL